MNAIETRQDGVRCVIVPNDQMETPHYHVLRVRKGEETPTFCRLKKSSLKSDECRDGVAAVIVPNQMETRTQLKPAMPPPEEAMCRLNVSVLNNLRWQPLPCRMCRPSEPAAPVVAPST